MANTAAGAAYLLTANGLIWYKNTKLTYPAKNLGLVRLADGGKFASEFPAHMMSHTARLVVWAQHGIYGAGADLDEAFGLIEAAEKAAEVYIKIAHLPRINTITDDQLRQLEKQFGVTAREGFLE